MREASSSYAKTGPLLAACGPSLSDLGNMPRSISRHGHRVFAVFDEMFELVPYPVAPENEVLEGFAFVGVTDAVDALCGSLHLARKFDQK